ncbi:MAG TPA: TolC family protein, partial [Methylotenera sp.]|nr:TolC family protein [Methylotenera sp.]
SLALVAAALMHSHESVAAPTFSLGQVVNIAAEQNPSINISRAREESASATIVTAKTYINPQIEMGAGPTSYLEFFLR